MAQPTMGIDVDSKELVTCIVHDEDKANALWETFKNQLGDFDKLCRWLTRNKISRVVMEATGGYEQKVARYLHSNGFSVYVVNPRQARHFALGIGLLAKNDKIDAFMLGRFGQVVTLPKREQWDEKQLELKGLLTRRHQVMETLQGERNRKRLAEGEMKASIERHIDFLVEEKELVEKEIKRVIKDHSPFKEKSDILKQVKGIGWVTAASLIGFMPELGCITGKKAASLAGLAPMANDSGARNGKREITGGRFLARKALYMPALVMMRTNPKMKTFSDRLLGRGKLNKVVITAVMRKIVVWANAIMKKYQKQKELQAQKAA